MSRHYRMTVEVVCHNEDKSEAIVRACKEEWPFDMDVISMAGEGKEYLRGEETTDEFAEKVSRAVWAANGGFCEVSIRCYDLENIPCDSYMYDEETYKEWLEPQ
jgi:hypothetical protein